MKSIPNIYPKELELKKTTGSPKHWSYLDLNITISGVRCTTDLYDKKEAFKFRIVNFPHMDSNILTKPTFGVFICQLVRYLGYVVITKKLLIGLPN